MSIDDILSKIDEKMDQVDSDVQLKAKVKESQNALKSTRDKFWAQLNKKYQEKNAEIMERISDVCTSKGFELSDKEDGYSLSYKNYLRFHITTKFASNLSIIKVEGEQTVANYSIDYSYKNTENYPKSTGVESNDVGEMLLREQAETEHYQNLLNHQDDWLIEVILKGNSKPWKTISSIDQIIDEMFN